MNTFGFWNDGQTVCDLIKYPLASASIWPYLPYSAVFKKASNHHRYHLHPLKAALLSMSRMCLGSHHLSIIISTILSSIPTGVETKNITSLKTIIQSTWNHPQNSSHHRRNSYLHWAVHITPPCTASYTNGLMNEWMAFAFHQHKVMILLLPALEMRWCIPRISMVTGGAPALLSPSVFQ